MRWLKLYEGFLEWEWFNKSEMVHLFIYLLLKANYADSKWRGETICRGQLVTSISTIQKDLGLTVQQIRTALKRLKLTGEITIKTTNAYSIVTICNYDVYQASQEDANKQNNTQSNNPITSEQQTNNKPTIIEEIEEKKKKPPKGGKEKDSSASFSPPSKEVVMVRQEKKKQDFYNSLIPYVETYGREMIRDFFDYWTEPNKSGTQWKFEQQPTWDTARRLRTWARNEGRYNRQQNYGTPPITQTNTQQAARTKRAADAASIIARLAAENTPVE